jgi:hypothetical protein
MDKPTGRPRGSGGKHTYEPPKWRFDELILGLGFESQIVEKLVRRGYPRVPASSIIGWRSRNSIPPIWLPVFIQMGLDEKLITNIEDLRVQ